jgi:hypothetical protein
VLYARWVRPGLLTWGATHDETTGAYPGDELVPGQHDPAVLDDYHVLARILDQIELMAGEQHRRPPAVRSESSSLMAPMAIGSRPENGSSSTSSSGSLTSAAIS